MTYSESVISPVQLFSVQFHTPPAHTLKKEHTVGQQHIDKDTVPDAGDYMSALTKHYILVEANVLVHRRYHGKHMDTEKQRYMFHFAG